MIKTFLYTLFGVCLFALGAVGAWYFVQMQMAAEKGGEATEQVAEENNGGGFSLPPIPSFDVSATAFSNEEPAPKPKPLPTPVPSKPISAEEIFRFGVINRERMEKLKAREDALDEREKRMALEYKDMEARHAEMEGLLAHVNDTLTAGESLLAQIRQQSDLLKAEREALDKNKAEFNNETGQTPADKAANEKQAAGLIESMNPDIAAEVLREFANNGRVEYALTMLQMMEERNAAKILDSLKDPGLLAELTSKLQKKKRIQTAGRSRSIR